MVVNGIIKKGEYFDSVSLMIVAKTINQMGPGIDSAVVMGTRENRAILDTAGLLLPAFDEAGDTDLLIAIKAETEEQAETILQKIEEQLQLLRKKDDSGEDFNPKSLEGALKVLPEANLSLISVAGKYAAAEAWKALENGLNVMLFSDNIPMEEEIKLKQYAHKNGLLVMGPDCGTAIINGVPLAFANVVNRGSIGVVAASGTGLQEVTTLISNSGEGISQALGTGGRDIKKDVGGITFIDSLKALGEDENTKVILLVSKPPHPEVLAKIGKIADEIDKPIAALFLGADKETLKQYSFYVAHNLEEAATLAVSLARGENDSSPSVPADELRTTASKETGFAPEQKYLRALYSGGTFCGEAQTILTEMEDVFSNAPLGNSQKLTDSHKSTKNTIVDMGEDEFTKGKPHPMIDFSTRNERIVTEANDPETKVILLDIVLGYGANMDPLSEVIPPIKKAKEIAQTNNRHLPIVCSVTGTDRDPQNRSSVVTGLQKAGALVLPSNAAATKLAALIIEK